MISTRSWSRLFVDDIAQLHIGAIQIPKEPEAIADVSAVEVIVDDGKGQAAVMIDVDHTPGPRGYRRWWICPVCRSRRSRLLVMGMAVGCRRCWHMHYRSQWRRSRSRLLCQLRT